MSNRTQLRERLRRELNDTTAPNQWTDTLLDDFLQEAAGWYSHLFPQQSTAYKDVAADQRIFDVPTGCLGVIQVECPPGRIIPREGQGTSAANERTRYRQTWSLFGGKVTLRYGASGDEVGAQKIAMRVHIPWERLDSVVDWSGPENDERLLVLWAAKEAWAWLDGQDQRRGRPGKLGAMQARAAAQLEQELAARRRRAGSRTMDVVE